MASVENLLFSAWLFDAPGAALFPWFTASKMLTSLIRPSALEIVQKRISKGLKVLTYTNSMYVYVYM